MSDTLVDSSMAYPNRSVSVLTRFPLYVSAAAASNDAFVPVGKTFVVLDRQRECRASDCCDADDSKATRRGGTSVSPAGTRASLPAPAIQLTIV
jgi:hypothetical protein